MIQDQSSEGLAVDTIPVVSSQTMLSLTATLIITVLLDRAGRGRIIQGEVP